MDISVIIPTHKRDAYLVSALKSVLSQTLCAKEILVIDDCMCSETQACVEKIAVCTAIPIYYYQNNIRVGPGASRNIGARKSKGEILAFLDDDDQWAEQYLEKATGILSDNNADFVLTAMVNVFDDGKHVPGKVPPTEFHYTEWVVRNPGGIGSNIVVKKDLWRAVGGYDEYLKGPEDKDFIIRLVKFGAKYFSFKERLVIHTEQDPTRITKFINWYFLKCQLRFYLRYVKYLNLCEHFFVWKKLILYFIQFLSGFPNGIRGKDR